MPSNLTSPRQAFGGLLPAVVAAAVCVGAGPAGAQLRLGGPFAMHPGMMPRPVVHGLPGHGLPQSSEGGRYRSRAGSLASVEPVGTDGPRHGPGGLGEGGRHYPPGGGGRHHLPGSGGHRHPPGDGVSLNHPPGGRGGLPHQIGNGAIGPASYARSSGPAVGNGFDNRRGGPPPRGERRFVPNELITEFSASTSPQAIPRLARRFSLIELESQRFSLIGTTLYRWRIGGRRSVDNVVRALGRQSVIASVQPNYLFALQEQLTPSAADASANSAQYVLTKLDVAQAHQIATGKDIPVAVIDSAVDAGHPDLGGSVGNSFDALGDAGKPQQHGTAMAGAIASHGKLIGIAPGAQVLAARAFDDSHGIAEGTSFAIYKALQWAADKGARA